jgi:hypothetical protein
MPFPVRCRSCQMRMRVPRRMAGKRFRCVLCGKVNIVPAQPAPGRSTARGTRIKIPCPKCRTLFRVAVSAPPGERIEVPIVLRIQCSTCHTFLEATSRRGAPPDPEGDETGPAPALFASPDVGTETMHAEPTSPHEPVVSPRRDEPAGSHPEVVIPQPSGGPGSTYASLGALALAAASFAASIVAGSWWAALLGGLAAALLAAGAMFHALAYFRGVVLPFAAFVAGLFVLLSAWVIVPSGSDQVVDGMASLPYPVPKGVAPSRLGPGEWVEVGRKVVQARHARVRLLRATVHWERPKGQGKKQPAAIAFEVQVEHVGRADSLRFAGWGGAGDRPGRRPRLTDPALKEYALVPPANPRAAEATLAPGEEAQEVLVFKPPPLTVKYLRLELPAEQVEQEGEFRLHVPRHMINDRLDD